jgi:hypothetical protein
MKYSFPALGKTEAIQKPAAKQVPFFSILILANIS